MTEVMVTHTKSPTNYKNVRGEQLSLLGFGAKDLLIMF